MSEGQKLVKADPSGKKRRGRKASKAKAGPKREKGDWVIRRPPTPELLAVLAPKQAGAHEEIGRLKRQIDASAEAHKLLKKTKEQEIGKIEERLTDLAQEVRYGETATVECWRHKEEGDPPHPPQWVYTDRSGQELWREAAADGQQQRLVGAETAPKPADEVYDTTGLTMGQCGAGGAGGTEERRDLVVSLLSLPDPPERPSTTGWPHCEISWHPRVRWCQERLLDEDDLLPPALPPLWPEDETKEVRQPTDEHRPDLDWKRIRLDGATAYRAEVLSGEVFVGEYRVERGAAANEGGSGKGLLQAVWAPIGRDRLELPGEHIKVGDAKAEADRHWQSRLLWLGASDSVTQLDSTGRYQLTRMKAADDDDLYRAEAVGMLGEPNTELTGSWAPLDEAKGACQAHADAGRWTR